MGTQCEATHDEPKVDEVEKKCEFADQPVVESVTSTDVPPQIRIYQLQYVKVNVAGVECNALNDSGYQIPVVSTRLFNWCGENAIGSVVLSGFSAGQRAEALLVSLDVCLSGDSDMCNIMEKMPLVCAIADLGSQDYVVILPTDVVAELKNLPVIPVAGPVMNDVMVTYDDTRVCNAS